VARPNIEKYSQQPKIPRVQLDYEDLLAKLQDDKLDLGQDATNPVTSSESTVDLTQQGLISPDNFLRAYGYDKNFQASNLNLQSPSVSVTADASINLGQSIDPTSPKASAEEVASVTDVLTRGERDAGFAAGKFLTPSVQGDSGDPITDLPHSGPPSKQPLDQQMKSLQFEPAFEGEKIKTPTSTFTYPTTPPGSHFHPDTRPSVGLPVIEGTGVEPTVPATGEDNLLNAINGTGRFAPGQEQPKTAEEAMGLLSDIYGPPSDKIFHDVRDTAGVRAITGVLSTVARSAIGPSLLRDPAGFAQNTATGIAQKMLSGGGQGIGFNPFTVKTNLEGIVDNWDKFGFLNKAAAATYVGQVATGVANVAKIDMSTEKFGNIFSDYLGSVTGRLNMLGEGVKEVLGDPVNVGKAVHNIIHRGSIGGTSTDLDLLHGRVSHSFDEKGKATTPGWISGAMAFTGPLSQSISLARGGTGKLLGGDDEYSQNAWNEVNAVIVGGARVDISSGGENETDTKVYANGNTAHLNLHVRNLADENYDLLANTTNLKGDAIIGELTELEQNSMFVGPDPFTGQNTTYRVKDINKQMLATWKGMGGKGNRPTADQYNALVQEKIKPHITMFNQAVNLAAGTTIVPEDKLHLANSRNVEQARDFFNGTHYTVDERGNRVFDAEEEREAEEGRAMTAYEKEDFGEGHNVTNQEALNTYNRTGAGAILNEAGERLGPNAGHDEIRDLAESIANDLSSGQIQKQAPLPVFRPPQRQPVYSSDPVDPPSTGYEDFSAW